MDSGAKNAVVGDQNFGTDLPLTQLEDEALAKEKNRARYSKTKEFQDLKEHMEARIEFFQNFLPDGKEVRWEAPDGKTALKWVVATNVINEFRAVLQAYGTDLTEAVTDAAKR